MPDTDRRRRLDLALAAVRLAVRRSLADLAPGATVLVACSGGADSLALLVGTAFVAPRLRLLARAVTVDHGLQAGSAGQAEVVSTQACGLGLPAEVLPALVGRDGGPEAAARTARYAALDQAAARHAAAVVLLGHSRDDQAETVLLGLARGAGARSLGGMARQRGHYRRPLLDLPRQTLRQAVAAAGLTPWVDPHNADPAYARSRVRHDVLPVLEAALGPGVAAALARTAALLRADADALDALAQDALTGADRLTVPRLAALAPAVRSRVLRAEAIRAGVSPAALSRSHVQALDALVVDWHGQGAVWLPGGLVGVRRSGKLRIGPPPP